MLQGISTNIFSPLSSFESRYDPGTLQTRKWENAFTIDKNSWGLNRNATLSDYMTVAELVHTLIKVVAFNGNVLVNVGPGPDGTINPIFIDRLLGIGTMRLICMLSCTLLYLRRRSLTDSFHLVLPIRQESG